MQLELRILGSGVVWSCKQDAADMAAKISPMILWAVAFHMSVRILEHTIVVDTLGPAELFPCFKCLHDCRCFHLFRLGFLFFCMQIRVGKMPEPSPKGTAGPLQNAAPEFAYASVSLAALPSPASALLA